MVNLRTSKRAVLVTSALMLPLVPNTASAYDMDCKVILCMAGGFPAPECSDAYAYMIARISLFPNPLPPFGFCPMSNGLAYTNYNAPYRYVGEEDPSAYVCPEGTSLFFKHREIDFDEDEITAFCYTDTVEVQVGGNDDPSFETKYLGRVDPEVINFEIRITVEPGTEHAYSSPLFRLNYKTGFVTPDFATLQAGLDTAPAVE